jgi:hypothetical protein
VFRFYFSFTVLLDEVRFAAVTTISGSLMVTVTMAATTAGTLPALVFTVMEGCSHDSYRGSKDQS